MSHPMTTPSYTEQARQKKTAEAREAGIDDALISELVEAFYYQVRGHSVLGPVFETKVKDWSIHLQRMKDFWASIALESGRYHGNPMLKHLAIPGISAAHFQAWLALWDATVADMVPNPSAASLFRDRAKRIATSLQTAIALHSGGLAALTKESYDVDER
jgi:hemoglobin